MDGDFLCGVLRLIDPGVPRDLETERERPRFGPGDFLKFLRGVFDFLRGVVCRDGVFGFLAGLLPPVDFGRG
jgi:hypothetical protein